MRLDKYLADLHIGSRSEVKEKIRQGLVKVNGQAVKDPGSAVSAADTVECGGAELSYREHFYYMLNKPAGLLSATEDARQQTVLDLFPKELRKGLSPVGRLDKDTVGLLLLTDDGKLAHRLLSPAHHVDKTYLVWTDAAIAPEDAECFAAGMSLSDGTRLQPAVLEIDAEDPRQGRITIREGKYHQIKRMFAARGKEVVGLKRLSMGGLKLDPALPEGAWRELTEEELSLLERSYIRERD